MKILLINKTNIEAHSITEKHIEKIKEINNDIEIALVPFTNREDIEKHAQDAEVIASHPGFIPSLSKTKNLKWIHSFSAGLDKVLTPNVVKSEIMVTNTPGAQDIPIAEHVLSFILTFTKKLYYAFRQKQNKVWKVNQDTTELYEKTVLVVGLGHIGKRIAFLANSFGANVIGIKRNTNDKPDFVSNVYSLEQLEEVIPKADFVVLSLPLTSSTKYLFDINKFNKMKNSAFLINICRGPVIKEEDLIQALEQKLIAGAGLDVTEEEPLPITSPLWQMDNVLITPHQSGLSEKFMDRAIDVFCLNLQAYLKGEKLPTLVDKERGY